MAQCPGTTGNVQSTKALFPMEFDPKQGHYIAQTTSYRPNLGHAYSLQNWFVLAKASAGWIVRAEYAIGGHSPLRTDPAGNNPSSTHWHPFSTSPFRLPSSIFHPSPILPNHADLLASPPRPPFPFSTVPPYHSSSSSSPSDPIQPQTPNRNTQACDPPRPFTAAHPSAHPRRPCTSHHHAPSNPLPSFGLAKSMKPHIVIHS